MCPLWSSLPPAWDSKFASLSLVSNSYWILVHFLADVQEDSKRKYFTSGAAVSESLDLLSPQPIIQCWLDQPNEKIMHDQVDCSRSISSGSPQPGSSLRQHRHRRKIKKSVMAFPPCHVLANNSHRPVTAPVRSDSDFLLDDSKPPKRSPKKKGNNKKGKHYKQATYKMLNLSSEVHCEENIDAVSPVEVLSTDLLAGNLSDTSSSSCSLVKEAHLVKDNDETSNNTDTSEFDGSTLTEHGCPYLREESNNYEDVNSLHACIYNSNDAAMDSFFNRLKSDVSVNCRVDDEAKLTIKDDNRHDHFQHRALTGLNNVKRASHLIGEHVSIAHAEDSNHSFGSSSCCSKHVAASSSHTERVQCSSEACSSKTSLPVISGRSSKRSRKTSNHSYLTVSNGAVSTNKHKHSGKYSSTSVWQKVEKLNMENTSKAGYAVNSATRNESALEDTKGVQHDTTRSMTTHKQRRKSCNQHSPDERVEEKDAVSSCQTFSRCMYKKQSKHASSQSSKNYHAPKKDMSMVPRNHLQQKNGLCMMKLIHDKDSSVRTNSISSADSGVDSNSLTEGNESSRSGVEKAALASCTLDSYLAPQAKREEACTSTVQEYSHSSCPASKAISTSSNSSNLCADPSTAEMEEGYVKLVTENTPQECCSLYSTSGRYCKLYSSGGHISQKWIPVGKKDLVHCNAPESSAVEASDLTNDITISANIDVEINVPAAHNEANKLAAEISAKPKLPGQLDLRCQACTETGTDFNKIRKAVCDAYRAQQRVEDVQVIIGRPLADFERFIYSASPVLYRSTCPAGRNFYSQEWIRDGLCFHQTTDINLSRIWQWYEEPGCYGLEVKAQEHLRLKGLCNDHYQFTTYFVPYLSAVQLFGQAKRKSTGSVDKEAAGMDMSSLPILAEVLPHRLYKRNSSSDLHTKDDQQFGSGELIFEFFESEQPFWRRQLFYKIKELISGVKPSNCQIWGDPKNLELSLCDLHPASWYCVAWYPIYRIPDGKFQAVFLTYHSLGHWVQGTSEHVVLPVTGLQCYNDKGERWYEMGRSSGEDAEWRESAWSAQASEVVKERLRTLNEGAAAMSRADVVKNGEMCRNRHPDYDFFLSHY